MPQNRGPIPSGFGGHSRLLLLKSAASVLAAQKQRSQQVCKTGCRRRPIRRNRRNHGNHQSTTQTTKVSDDIQARVEESVKAQLDQYAKFIDSTPSYVITEALKVLFKRDDEFEAWLDQHANNHNQELIQGDALTKTA